MRISCVSKQNFNAKFVGVKPIVDIAAKEGMPQVAIERAINKIHHYLPNRNDSLVVEEKYAIFKMPTIVWLKKENGLFRYTQVDMDNTKSDIYKLVNAAKKLSEAKYTEELDMCSIDI